MKEWSDTVFTPGSLAAALRAVGGACHAVEEVLRGTCRNAMCIVRPPGHHAGVSGLSGDSQSCGFCIFNTVAIAAMHALEGCGENNVQRVAIVDFDVHHGQGAEIYIIFFLYVFCGSPLTSPLTCTFFFSFFFFELLLLFCRSVTLSSLNRH